MENLEKYLAVFKDPWLEVTMSEDLTAEEIEEQQKALTLIAAGYLARIIYNKDDGSVKALKKAHEYLDEHWYSVILNWGKEEVKEEKKSAYAGYTELYQ